MADPAPVLIPPTPVQQLFRGQLRIAVAAIAGSLVLHHVLPAALVNDQTLDYVTGLVLLGGAALWQGRRAILQHAKWLQVEKQVSDDIVAVAK